MASDIASSRWYWDAWYQRAAAAPGMGRRSTYQAALNWLDLDGAVLEDWGGGLGYLRDKTRHAAYRCVDWVPQADVQVPELARYSSDAECILIRHVLEHNPETWRAILANAAHSYTRRLCLVLFLPLAEHTGPDGKNHVVPHWRLARSDIEAITGPPVRELAFAGYNKPRGLACLHDGQPCPPGCRCACQGCVGEAWGGPTEERVMCWER
jgi:hypothetical protein